MIGPVARIKSKVSHKMASNNVRFLIDLPLEQSIRIDMEPSLILFDPLDARFLNGTRLDEVVHALVQDTVSEKKGSGVSTSCDITAVKQL